MLLIKYNTNRGDIKVDQNKSMCLQFKKSQNSEAAPVPTVALCELYFTLRCHNCVTRSCIAEWLYSNDTQEQEWMVLSLQPHTVLIGF